MYMIFAITGEFEHNNDTGAMAYSRAPGYVLQQRMLVKAFQHVATARGVTI